MPRSNVAAIIAVRNGANYLSEAIHSCLSQTVVPAEILVVDDGSTDMTSQIAETFAPQVKLIQQEWSGCGAALNLGVSSARSEIIAFLDHDDLWAPQKTALQLAEIQSDPKVEAIFGHVRQFISPELKGELEGKIQVPAASQPGIQISAMMIRRSAFERLGLFDGEKDGFAFPNWYARAVNSGLKSKMLSDTVSSRRIHLSNYTREQRDHYHDRLLSFARGAAMLRRTNALK